MCTRKTEDPLARLFLDRYGLHLLRMPRRDVDVGVVYPQYHSTVSNPGKIEYLLQPAPKLPPVKRGEPLADISATTSDAVSTELGLNLLENFFDVLGAIGFSTKMQASFAAKKATGIRFRFAQATRDSVDPFALERQLREIKCQLQNSLIKEDYRYYVVIGVFRSDSVSFTAVDKNQNALSLNVKAAKTVGVKAGIKVEQGVNEEITVTGGQRLAFGVQLSELQYNKARQRLGLAVCQNLLQVRTFTGANYSMIGGPEDDIFLQVN